MSYVDTTLIECNRKSSPQYLGGNDTEPYHWTNKCGDGITLDIGDKISVHSSYISEIGNESSTIECHFAGIGGFNNWLQFVTSKSLQR